LEQSQEKAGICTRSHADFDSQRFLRTTARAGDRSEISQLQDRAEMPREKQQQPSALIRPQDLQTATRPEFIDDIVRELTEGE
jgi:hypothetical protein